MSATQSAGTVVSAVKIELGSFAEEDFNVKNWINNALESGGSNVEQHASTLAMKLQLLAHELANSLEQANEQAIRNMPRVAHDLEFLHKDSANLKQTLGDIKKGLESSEKRTESSLKSLSEIDRVKGRMEDSMRALQEAQNWKSLSADMEVVLTSGNFQEAADKLQEMERSLIVLKSLPEYETNKDLLLRLQSRFQAMLSPRVIAAITERDIQKTSEYYQIFKQTHKMEDFNNYYYRTKKQEPGKVWKTFKSDDTRGDEPAIVSWLSSFYDHFLTLIAQEVAWISQVVENPQALISALVTQTLSSLDPPLQTRIKTSLDLETARHLPQLVALYQQTQRFAAGLEKILTDPGLQKQKSVVFLPFGALQEDYPILERKYLLFQLKAIKLDDIGMMDSIRLIADSSSRLFQIAEVTVDRCLIFTLGFSALGLSLALDEYFKELFQKLGLLLKQIRKSCGLDGPKEKPKKPAANIEDSLDAEPAFAYEQDWSHLQGALRVTEICFSISRKIAEIEATFREKISRARQAILDTPMSLEEAEDSTSIQMVVLKTQQSSSQFFDLKKYLHDTLVENQPPSRQLPTLFETFTRDSQKFLLDSMFKSVEQELAAIPKLGVWNPVNTAKPGFEIPSFSFAPSPYITKTGEHLLGLPQQLEPYSDCDYLTLGNQWLPWIEPTELSNSTSVGEEGEAPDFTELWIISTVRSTMRAYLTRLLEIPHLNASGTKQLLADLQYFRNVLSALEIALLPEFDEVQKLLSVSSDELKGMLNDKEREPTPVFEKIAAMRGVSLAVEQKKQTGK